MYRRKVVCGALLLLLNAALLEAGYIKASLERLMVATSMHFGDSVKGLNMVEFGGQIYYGSFPSCYGPFADFNYTAPSPLIGSPVKHYFETIGMQHLSIDINGLYGAVSMDVRTDISSAVFRHFGSRRVDIVTNVGFSEHVGEGSDKRLMHENQYAIFRNMHEIGSASTLYFHHVPHYDHWKTHGVCGYDTEFFDKLIEQNGYRALLGPVFVVDQILTVFHRTDDRPFMTLEEFKFLPGIRDRYHEHSSLVPVQYYPPGSTEEKVTIFIDGMAADRDDQIARLCHQIFPAAEKDRQGCVDQVLRNVLSHQVETKRLQ